MGGAPPFQVVQRFPVSVPWRTGMLSGTSRCATVFWAGAIPPPHSQPARLQPGIQVPCNPLPTACIWMHTTPPHTPTTFGHLPLTPPTRTPPTLTPRLAAHHPLTPHLASVPWGGRGRVSVPCGENGQGTLK